MARQFVSSSSQYVHYTSSAPVTAYPITLVVWANPTANNQALVAIGNSASVNRVQIAVSPAQRVNAQSINSSGSSASGNPLTTIPFNQWSHIATVFRSNTSRQAYLNGVPGTTSTTNIDVDPASFNYVTLGARISSGTPGAFYSGALAEFAVFTSELSETDIVALAQRHASPLDFRSTLQMYVPLWGYSSPEQDLVGTYHLTNTGSTRSDHPPITIPQIQRTTFASFGATYASGVGSADGTATVEAIGDSVTSGGGTVVAESVSSASWADADANAKNITKPTGLAEGDLLLAVVALISSRNITAPAGWSTQVSFTHSSGTQKLLYTWKIADAADVAASSFTFTVSGTFSGARIALLRLSGATSDGIVDEFSSGGNTNGVVCPNITPAAAGSLLLWGFGQASTAWTGSGYSRGTEFVDVGGLAIATETTPDTSTQTGASFTKSGFSNHIPFALAISPSGGSSGTVNSGDGAATGTSTATATGASIAAAVGSSTGTATATAVGTGVNATADAFLLPETGSDGDVVDPTYLNANKQGAGSWSYSPGHTQSHHAKVKNTGITHGLSVNVGGTEYNGAGARRMQFDMETAYANRVAISSMDAASEAVIHTTTPHGFAVGDRVRIEGITGVSPDINGTSVVMSVVDSDTFTISRSLSTPGTGGDAWLSYDSFLWSPEPGLTEQSVVMYGVMEFNATGVVSADSRIDHWIVNAGAFCALQQQINFNHDPVGGGILTAHGAVGGSSTFGLGFEINPNTPYLVTMFADAVGQACWVLIQDALTFEFIGASRAASAINSSIASVQMQDYLTPHGGTTDIEFVALDWTNKTFPVAPFVLPGPASISLTQEGADAISVEWTSLATHFNLERQKDGGTWETLATDLFPTTRPAVYEDTGLEPGSYAYRVTAKLGSYATAAATTSDTFELTGTVVSDDFTGLGFGAPLYDRTNWDSYSNHSGSIGWSSGTVFVGTNSLDYYNTPTAGQNQRAEVELVLVDIDGVGGPAVRIQTTARSGYAICGGTGNNIALFRIIDGVKTQINVSDIPLATGMKLAIEAIGTGSATRLNGYYDTGSGWVQVFTEVDPVEYLDGGQWGLYGSRASGGTNTVDNWVGRDLAGEEVTIVSGVGAADGAGDASATGRAIVATVGASTGAATVAATATSIASAIGATSGTATVTASATRTAASAGVSTGTATAAALSKKTAEALGAASGSAIVDGASTNTVTVTGVGDSTGAATVAGSGASIASAVGAATGSSTITASGKSTSHATGASTGAASVAATGRVIHAGAASASGSSDAAANATSTASATGSATGTSTATGSTSQAGASPGVGSATGVATVAATSKRISSAVGIATGTSLVTAHGVTIRPGIGSVESISEVLAVSKSIRSAAGDASGSGVVSGRGGAIIAAAGVASGSALDVDGASTDAQTKAGRGEASGASAVVGHSQSVRSATADASGASSVVTYATKVLSGAGISSGSATAASTATRTSSATGSASGEATGSATSKVTSQASGHADGMTTVIAQSDADYAPFVQLLNIKDEFLFRAYVGEEAWETQ